MDVYSAEGVWWRPEASQHRVPGTLTSDEDGVELVVYGPLRQSPSKVGVVKIEGSEWVATPVVHGRTRDGEDITLLDVDGLMSLPIPSDEVRETHTVSVACIGGHFSGDAFIEAQAEFDWLDAWLDPPAIVDDNINWLPRRDGRPRWPLRACPRGDRRRHCPAHQRRRWPGGTVRHPSRSVVRR